ncbi:hypothetical protein [Antribacter gilvus]|uniref:hypothetical protein n=1 Tax=Antribacter gilvus TaxID=2304675 RepID=UPI000F7954D7|nr:hypothetical protein [Antribacter gilvus]
MSGTGSGGVLATRLWIWGVGAVVAAAVLTAPLVRSTACAETGSACLAEVRSLVGIPTNWSVFGIAVVLTLAGLYLTMRRKPERKAP